MEEERSIGMLKIKKYAISTSTFVKLFLEIHFKIFLTNDNFPIAIYYR